MKATYNVTVKFTMIQEIDRISDIVDPHDIAQFVCDNLTDENVVAAYEVIETTIDVR